MQPPKLLIRKGMVVVQGRNRPCIQVLAVVEPAVKAKLEESFGSEYLFKRSSYSMGFPAGTPMPTPTLAPYVAALIKNDACPEITVKTMLAAQLFQAQSVWEMKAFEYIACRAFDAFLDFTQTVIELGTETTYAPADAQRLGQQIANASDAAAAAALAMAASPPAAPAVATAA